MASSVPISQVVEIIRNVTGRVDASDPLFTDAKMVQYLENFLQLESTQDIRIFKNRTWYEFTLGVSSPDPFPVDLGTIGLINGAIGASTIEPPCYADGFYVFWFEDPAEFYRIWPETQEYTPTRPTYVLYYNGELTFRNPPNRDYLIKMAAYQVEFDINPEGNLEAGYMYRYAAYGTALNIFSDFGEMDKYAEIFPVFKRYRALVYSRTNSQYQNQRAGPDF